MPPSNFKALQTIVTRYSIRKIGNTLGVLFRKELIQQSNMERGDVLVPTINLDKKSDKDTGLVFRFYKKPKMGQEMQFLAEEF